MNVEKYLLGLIDDLKKNKEAVTSELTLTADYSRAQACLCTALRDYRRKHGGRIPAVNFPDESVYIDDFSGLNIHMKMVRGFIKHLLLGGSAKKLHSLHNNGWQRVIKKLPVHIITTRWTKQAIDRYRVDHNTTILAGSTLFGMTNSYAQPVPSHYHLPDEKLIVFIYHYLKTLHGSSFALHLLEKWESLKGYKEFLANIEAGFITDETLHDRLVDIVMEELRIEVV